MDLTMIRQQILRFLPALFIIFVMAILWKGLHIYHEETHQREFPFPEFSLADIREGDAIRTLENIKGQISIVHIWASWCGICIKEHDEWLNIKNLWSYPLIGIIYRDDAKKVIEILNNKGDPYTYLLNDTQGSLGLDLGIRGTPETYIIDREGVIRFHHLGPLTQNSFETILLPVLERLENENA